MSIIGNTASNQTTADEATVFLAIYRATAIMMERSAKEMLTVKLNALDKDSARRYDRAHKRMVQLTRHWNAIEHERERPDPPKS